MYKIDWLLGIARLMKWFVHVYTVVKVDGATPKFGLVRGHDKPKHGSYAIYSAGGVYMYIYLYIFTHLVVCWVWTFDKLLANNSWLKV